MIALEDVSPRKGTSKWCANVSMLMALFLFLGCSASEGPERFPVSGTVKFDSKELASGIIRFVPTGGAQGPATSATIQNGHYEFTDKDGPISGGHRIEIEATEYLGFAIDDEAAFAANIRQTRKALPTNPVPPNYNRQSTLTADVAVDGPREFNFDLFSATKKTGR